MNLTPVVFTFFTPQGVPLGETPFTIHLVRAGYDQQVGFVFPETIEVETDINGTATVNLAPTNQPYFVEIEGGGFCTKQSYRFYVPESVSPVNFQDLVDEGQYDPLVLTDEKIQELIVNAAKAQAAAQAAKVSETNAKASEDVAAAAAAEATSSAAVVVAAVDTAVVAAETAVLAKDQAVAASGTAVTSANAAAASALAAAASEQAAITASNAAETARDVAVASAANASTSESNASASEAAAAQSAQNAAASDVRVTALKNEVEGTYQSNVLIKQEMDDLHAAMLAIGSGWTPKFQLVQDGVSRVVLQIVDWQYGTGTKPPVGYMGATGIVATSAEAINIRGANGVDGSSFTVNATGPFSERPLHDDEPAGFAFLSTDNGLLYIREGAAGGWSPGIPFGKGDKGDTGDRGATGADGPIGPVGPVGPANTLTIGTVTTNSHSAATITGTAPNQVLNLVLQKGDKGDTGQTGADGQGWSAAQSNKLAGIQEGATKNLADAVLLARENHTGGFNGFGKYNSMLQDSALPFTSAPSTFVGKGTLFGIVRGSEIGLGFSDYGVGRVDAQWSDLSPPFAFIRTVWCNDREYVSHAVNASTWSPWVETTSVAGTTGLADALDAAMRVRLLSEPTILGFLDQMWHLGPGYYRNDSVNPDTQLYGAGFFSKTSDTWSFMSVDRTTGTPMFLSGIYADIAAGSQKKFLLGNAAKATVQTDVKDATAGRVMTVGAFGLGGTNVFNDTNLATITPFPIGVSYGYLNRAVNAPYTDFYGYITVEKIDSLYAVITVASVGEGYKFKRTFNNGVAGPWIKVIDSITAVGTIATGSIFERGTNSNGSYTKFADGLMICHHIIGGISPSNATSVTNIYRSNSVLWTYPATFAGNVCLSHGEIGGIGLCWTGLGAVGVSTSSGSVSVYSMTQTGSVTVGLTAVGRWK